MLGALLACNDATAPNAVGTYALTRFNGSPLPATIATDPTSGQTASVTGGTLSLDPRNRWEAEVNISITSSAGLIPQNEIMSGTYRVSRDTIYFSDAANTGTIAALFDGTTITATTAGDTFVFTRR